MSYRYLCNNLITFPLIRFISSKRTIFLLHRDVMFINVNKNNSWIRELVIVSESIRNVFFSTISAYKSCDTIVGQYFNFLEKTVVDRDLIWSSLNLKI